MTSISIRPLYGDEFLDVLFNFQMYAFRASPPFGDREEWMNIVRARKDVIYHVLFEDEVPVAAAANTAMTQNVRVGCSLQAACGLWLHCRTPGGRDIPDRSSRIFSQP